jgi:hypothetical protein
MSEIEKIPQTNRNESLILFVVLIYSTDSDTYLNSLSLILRKRLKIFNITKTIANSRSEFTKIAIMKRIAYIKKVKIPEVLPRLLKLVLLRKPANRLAIPMPETAPPMIAYKKIPISP